MQIQTNTNESISGGEGLAALAESAVESALGRFSEQITSVHVHLSDENGAKGGANDKRCMMEARIEGRRPVAVTDEAATIELAINGAADKLERSIESMLGRLRDR